MAEQAYSVQEGANRQTFKLLILNNLDKKSIKNMAKLFIPFDGDFLFPTVL